MNRKEAREIALHLVFGMEFRSFSADEVLSDYLDKGIMESVGSDVALYAKELDEKQFRYIRGIVIGIADHLSELDALIEQNARGWSMKRISRITMAVLRLAIYEMQYVEDVPTSVAINEAVNLAKAYETEDTGTFVNGILGAISRAQGFA